MEALLGPIVSAERLSEDPVFSDRFLPQDTVGISEPLVVADHTMQKVQGGVFTPSGDKMDVEIALSAKYWGVGHQSVFFAWNQDVDPGENLMTGQGFLVGAYVAGTERKTVGPVSGPGNTGLTSRRFRLTGLTPGVPVTWEVSMGSTGYYEKIDYAAGSYPVDMALSNDHRTLYVSLYNAGKVVCYDPGNRWSTDGTIVQKSEFNGHAGAYGLAVHPTNDNLIYIVRRTDNQVVEVDTRDGSVLRTFAVTSPLYLCISADASKLFVVRQDAFQDVIPITLATGIVGASIDVGDLPFRPVARGNYIYVPCATANTVDRIHIGTHAVTSLAMGAASTPVWLSLDPDGTRLWVLEKAVGFKRVRAINTDTFTFTADAPVTGLTAGSPNAAMVSPSGRSMVVLGSASGNDLETYVLPARGVIYETGGQGDMGVGVLTMEGDILAINVVDAGALYHWHAARIEIDPDDEFWGGFLAVRFTGAIQ